MSEIWPDDRSLLPMQLKGEMTTGLPGENTGQSRLSSWSNSLDGQAVAFVSQYRNAINWAINDACVPKSQRDDVRQEVAVRIIERFRRQGPLAEGNHAGFAIRVARNACIDHFRRQPPSSAEIETVRLADEAIGPEDALIRLQGHERLHRAIATLSPVRRYIVRQVMAGVSLLDLAEELGRSHSSLKALHHRAVNDLRQILRPKNGSRR